MLKKMFFVVMLALGTSQLLALSNLEVAQKADKAMDGYGDSQSDMHMTLINAQGDIRERKMRMKSLELKGGDKSLMEFLSPADVKGTKFLNYEHYDKDDDQWLYLPALRRVKRIASKNKSGSFMGSEFAYEDLSNFSVEKYQYEGDAKVVDFDGRKVYKVVSTPVSKNSGYTKVISYVDTKDFLVRKVEYFDRKKELFKRVLFSGYKKISGVWRMGKIEMKNFDNDKQSTLVWRNQKIKKGLSQRHFHKRVLKR
jgi:outer membrane lipoprotein-sorting protein